MYLKCLSGCSYHYQKENSAGNNSSNSGYRCFLRNGGFVQIQKHDHKQEQYHDGARVNNEVNDSKKLGIQENVMTSHRYKAHNQREDANNPLMIMIAESR